MLLLVQFKDNGSKSTISIGMINMNLEKVEIRQTDKCKGKEKNDRKDDNMKEKQNIKERRKSPHRA